MPASLSFSSGGVHLHHSSSSFRRASPRYVYSRRNGISCKLGKVERERNPYKVLSLNQSENVGVDEIKKAYRAMALQYHPDVCPPSKREEFTRMFVEAHKAYKTLSDPFLRRRYDRELGLDAWRGTCDGTTRLEFHREAWESQLRELKKRSDSRMKSKVEP